MGAAVNRAPSLTLALPKPFSLGAAAAVAAASWLTEKDMSQFVAEHAEPAWIIQTIVDRDAHFPLAQTRC